MKDETYLIAVYLAYETGKYAVDGFGIFFSDTLFRPLHLGILPVEPQVKNKKGNFLYNKDSAWVRFTDTFIAAGGEQYLYIGNFTHDKEIRGKVIDKRAMLCSVYGLDDVSVTPIGHNPCADAPTAKAPAPDSSFTLGSVRFAHDSHDLLPASYEGLDSLCAWMERRPEVRIEVQGHTDSMGTEAYNLELSARRAEAVVNYLLGKGVDAGRLTSKGSGSAVPRTGNDTAEGRAQNRRVEVRVVAFD